MRINGKIYLELVDTESSNGRDDNGASVESSIYWSDAIPCHIATNNDTRLGRTIDGEFRQASYTVLVEPEFLKDKHFVRIRLKRAGESLGIYKLSDLQPVQLQNRIKMIVHNNE